MKMVCTGWICYSYGLAGQLTETLLANGMRTTYVYDPGGCLTLLANLTSTGTTLPSFAYTLDPAGNRTGAVVEDGSRMTWTYGGTRRGAEPSIL